jgi:tetratricopeptide (TPR) repeat protein
MAKPLLTKRRLAALDEAVREAFGLQQARRYAEAEQRYREVLGVHPHNFDALHMLGLICHELGRQPEALALIGAALKVKASAPDAFSNHGIVLHALQRYEEALASFDRALKLKPDHAEVLANRGNALLRLERIEAALGCYERAIALKPDYFTAHYNRGNALFALGRASEALESYDRALALAPSHPDILINRGNALLRLGRTAEALASYEQALALAPASAEAANNRGNALVAMGEVAQALASFDTALALDPAKADAVYNAGMARLALGDFADGWAQYEARWNVSQFVPQRRNFTPPLWLGREPLDGKTILLHAEQGFGDTLQFVRYVPRVAARGARVLLEVQAPLKSLLAATPGIAAIFAGGEPLPAFDYQCPLMSLPLAFGTALATIPADVPYVGAPPDRAARWRARLAAVPRPRIGLVWSGRPTHINDRNRSIAPHRLLPLLADPHAAFVGLQRDVRPEDEAVLRAHARILDIGSELIDFADTAAAIAELDLVISVDTAVVHLAGAIGKPVWILLPHAVDFRWMYGRDDSPWYPSARLFRQTRAGDWDDVVARVGCALKSCVGAYPLSENQNPLFRDMRSQAARGA